jgi:formamidopyrimidine-DNA glycosylase
MPELPEVETIVRDLRQAIVGKTITAAAFLTRSVWRVKPPKPIQFIGSRIAGIRRKGKNILIYLSNGNVLVVHLKMTGRLTCDVWNAPVVKHTHFIIDFDDGQLRFNDIRRFGYLDLVREDRLGEIDYLAAQGPDALEIRRDEFIKTVRSRKRMIKPMLLDQTFIAGMGNIYGDEALYLAGIAPKRVSSGLSAARAGRLYDAMIEVLEKAIASRGSSVDDYVDGRGNKGSYQEHHLVYGREGEPCKRCGRPIKRLVIGSRSAHFCPRCQK